MTMPTRMDHGNIDSLDRRIIVATQRGLPLVSRPYDQIAEQLDISASELKRRIIRMQEAGIIRRIGGVPNHYALGYRANGMSVWDVPDERIDRLGKKVGALAFVSHCYHRPRRLPDWPYNLFAMVHAHDREQALHYVAQIAALLGADNRAHDVLFSSRILKKTGLRLKEIPIHSVPPERVNSVCPELVNSVPPERVNSVCPELVNSVPPERVNSVCPEHVNSVPPERVNSVPPEHVNSVPPEVVNSVPPERVNSVPPEVVNSVPPERVNSVPPKHVNSVRPELVEGLSTNGMNRK